MDKPKKQKRKKVSEAEMDSEDLAPLNIKTYEKENA